MNCPIVHVVQVIKKGKKINKNVCRVYHSLKNNIPIDSCGATFHNPGLKTSFTCWTTGLGEQLAASLHHLQLCYRGSCLSSHLEEKWPRVIDRNSAATDFILTQWGKTQPQEGFFFLEGLFSELLKNSGRFLSSQRIFPIWECGWIANQRLTQIKNLRTLKPATFNFDH